jgi:hypothetical protein
MSIHLQSSVKVQRQACWALLTLAGSDEVARVIVGQGGDSQLMRAMGHWKHDAGVQQFACWAICNLALADEEIKQKMRHSGILEVPPLSLPSLSLPSLSVLMALCGRCVTSPWRPMRAI